MKLTEENIEEILVKDMPEPHEYSQIIYDCRESNEYIKSDYEKFSQLDFKVKRGLENLIARCIARGKRLQKEANDANV